MPLRSLPYAVALLALAGGLVQAQVRDTAGAKPGGATISGVVHDSVADRPLAGAAVQLIVADTAHPLGRMAMSDSQGRFAFTGVPDGRYTLGFFHPMLDSLGLEPPLRELEVRGQPVVRVQLAIPSRDRIRDAICGPRAPGTGGLLLGVVRDARNGAPVAAATVTAEWLELTIRKGGVERNTPRLIATTSETGWFAVCDVPSGGTMFVTAMHEVDSTDVIDVEVPRGGFARLDLYVGPSRVVAVEDTTQRGDSALAGRRRVGDGHLSGEVRTAAAEWRRGRPLANARVLLSGGVESRTNDAGEWALTNAPLGTRILEVRSLGYFPERRAVHIVADGATPLRIGLSTMKAMLDTIRVTASRLSPEMQEFEKRRRSGTGRYYTAEDIAKRHLFNTSDLLRMVPGVRIDNASGGAFDRPVTVRGAFGNCSPALYLDGHYIPSFQGLTVDEIDQWVSPEDVAGIEIYTSIVPPRFQQPFSNCGSIVIWTQPPLGRSRMSLKRRLAATSVFMTGGILLGQLLVYLVRR